MFREEFAYHYQQIKNLNQLCAITHCYIQYVSSHWYKVIAFCPDTNNAEKFTNGMKQLFPATTSGFMVVTYEGIPSPDFLNKSFSYTALLGQYVQDIIVKLVRWGSLQQAQMALHGAREFIFAKSSNGVTSIVSAVDGILDILKEQIVNVSDLRERIQITVGLYNSWIPAEKELRKNEWLESLARLLAGLSIINPNEDAISYIVQLIDHIIVVQSKNWQIRSWMFMLPILQKAIALIQEVDIQRPYQMSASEKWQDANAKQQLLKKLEENYPEIWEREYVQQAINNIADPAPFLYNQLQYNPYYYNGL